MTDFHKVTHRPTDNLMREHILNYRDEQSSYSCSDLDGVPTQTLADLFTANLQSNMLGNRQIMFSVHGHFFLHLLCLAET